MKQSYQSPEAVEVGRADSIILGGKGEPLFDQPTMSFIRDYPDVVDVDE